MTILTFPNDSLRVKASPVEKVTPELQAIAKEMYDVMLKARGIGLAATQVGLDMRLIVMNNNGTPLYIFNPVIIAKSSHLLKGKEGCLSFPGEEREIKRADSVTIKYRDINNKMQYRRLDGLQARILLHEYDHLQGVVFTDYEIKE